MNIGKTWKQRDRMKRMDVNDLNQIYQDSEEIDKEQFSEMRSNVLLVAGEHYTKNVNKHFARLRETNRLTEHQKLRLTKNHIYRIVKTYVNGILDKVPGVQVVPKNETEMQDRKAAELNDAVWTDIKERHNMKEKIRKWANEFVEIGECAVKVFWDPNKGDFIGYDQAVDEKTGEPLYLDETGSETIQPGAFDEFGQMVMQFEPAPDEESPVFSGQLCYETIHAFNLLRSPASETMEDSPYLINRKMVDKRDLMKMYSDDPEKQKMLKESSTKGDFLVFDSNKAGYDRTKNQILIKEIYYKPCLRYPNGYFYIWNENGILEEGELPYGIFPIKWCGFDEYATTPRARSVVKVARPYQAEINRAASQMATHQITLGDDKVIYQSGSKLSPGALLPGVRGIAYQGTQPTILPGRTGDQYLAYINTQIDEMYQAVFLDKVAQKEEHNLDPYSLLFRTMSQQSVYKQYVQKFEKFVVDIAELSLQLARHYLPEDAIIGAVGKNEVINISEFRNTKPFEYQVNVEPMSDSIDTMLGKQMTFTHMLQYVGKNLTKEDIGKIMKNMPFVNNEEMFGDMTINYENVTNDMLALERGEPVQVGPLDDNEYYIQKLDHRMKQADFKLLAPQIQQQYQMFKQQHLQEMARKAEEIKRAQSEYIPTGGAMITCQMRVKDPDGEGTKQVRIPYQAMDWLIKQLESQGMGLEKLENMSEGSQAELSQMVQDSLRLQEGQNQPMNAPMPDPAYGQQLQ